MSRIPYTPNIPSRVPQDPKQIGDWMAREFIPTFELLYRRIARVINSLLIQGSTTDRPTATGSKTFYFDEDTDTLYYDSGTWETI